MLLPWPQAALGTEAKDSKEGLPWWSSGYSELPVQGPGFHPWSRGELDREELGLAHCN